MRKRQMSRTGHGQKFRQSLNQYAKKGFPKGHKTLRFFGKSFPICFLPQRDPQKPDFADFNHSYRRRRDKNPPLMHNNTW
jgi:hypothetical protein